MGRIRIHTRRHTKEKPYKINLYFQQIGKAKKSKEWAKYMFLCKYKDMCWRNFLSFPWWLKNVKNGSKIALFSNGHHFEMCFPKIKIITFFLKQGQTRASSGPITLPVKSSDLPNLTHLLSLKRVSLMNGKSQVRMMYYQCIFLLTFVYVVWLKSSNHFLLCYFST